MNNNNAKLVANLHCKVLHKRIEGSKVITIC